jgi:hypothetical protein
MPRTNKHPLKKLRDRSILSAWWLVHRLTTPWRALPNFLIIGVMKGGTTSLFKYLAEHPQVAAPFRKEIKFFDSNYSYGLGWYRAHFPLASSLRNGLLSGEASPYYIFHPTAPERIHSALPDTKLIVLLRNPVERAFSHYQHMVRVGAESLSFEEALGQEELRLAGEAEKIAIDPRYSTANHVRYSYKARGRYFEQLKKWYSLYPDNQILVLKSEDLSNTPSVVFQQTLDFLSLPGWEPKQYDPHNKGIYQDMPSAVRKHLAAYFKPYNQQLYSFLGRDFCWDNVF